MGILDEPDQDIREDMWCDFNSSEQMRTKAY